MLSRRAANRRCRKAKQIKYHFTGNLWVAQFKSTCDLCREGWRAACCPTAADRASTLTRSATGSAGLMEIGHLWGQPAAGGCPRPRAEVTPWLYYAQQLHLPTKMWIALLPFRHFVSGSAPAGSWWYLAQEAVVSGGCYAELLLPGRLHAGWLSPEELHHHWGVDRIHPRLWQPWWEWKTLKTRKASLLAASKASVFHAQLMTAGIQVFQQELRGPQASFTLDRSSPTCVRPVWICSVRLSGFAWRTGSGAAQCLDASAEIPMTPPAMWRQPSLDHWQDSWMFSHQRKKKLVRKTSYENIPTWRWK